MIDEVAKELCLEAGKSQSSTHGLITTGGYPSPGIKGESLGYGICLHCDEKGKCTMLEAFRAEARRAIFAAYVWHKKERRWPSFCK